MTKKRMLRCVQFDLETAKCLNKNIVGPELLLQRHNHSKPWTNQTTNGLYRTFIPLYADAPWGIRQLRTNHHLATVFDLKSDKKEERDRLYLLTFKINKQMDGKGWELIDIHCRQKLNELIIIADSPKSDQTRPKEKSKTPPPPPPPQFPRCNTSAASLNIVQHLDQSRNAIEPISSPVKQLVYTTPTAPLNKFTELSIDDIIVENVSSQISRKPSLTYAPKTEIRNIDYPLLPKPRCALPPISRPRLTSPPILKDLSCQSSEMAQPPIAHKKCDAQSRPPAGFEYPPTTIPETREYKSYSVAATSRPCLPKYAPSALSMNATEPLTSVQMGRLHEYTAAAPPLSLPHLCNTAAASLNVEIDPVEQSVVAKDPFFTAFRIGSPMLIPCAPPSAFEALDLWASQSLNPILGAPIATLSSYFNENQSLPDIGNAPDVALSPYSNFLVLPSVWQLQHPLKQYGFEPIVAIGYWPYTRLT